MRDAPNVDIRPLEPPERRSIDLEPLNWVRRSDRIGDESPNSVIGDGDTIVFPEVPTTIFEGEA